MWYPMGHHRPQKWPPVVPEPGGHLRHTDFGIRTAIDVEGEVFVVDLLVGAVGADRLDRGIEFFQQLGVFLADTDADAFAKLAADIALAPDLVLIAALALQDTFLQGKD